jgi:hypothetical protein
MQGYDNNSWLDDSCTLLGIHYVKIIRIKWDDLMELIMGLVPYLRMKYFSGLWPHLWVKC